LLAGQQPGSGRSTGRRILRSRCRTSRWDTHLRPCGFTVVTGIVTTGPCLLARPGAPWRRIRSGSLLPRAIRDGNGFWFLSMRSSPRARPSPRIFGGRGGVRAGKGTYRLGEFRGLTIHPAVVPRRPVGLEAADPPSRARVCSSLLRRYLPAIALLLRDP
jgi:hypothetical protein